MSALSKEAFALIDRLLPYVKESKRELRRQWRRLPKDQKRRTNEALRRKVESLEKNGTVRIEKTTKL